MIRVAIMLEARGIRARIALPSRARSGGLAKRFMRSSLERSKRDHPTSPKGSLGGPAYFAPGCSA